MLTSQNKNQWTDLAMKEQNSPLKSFIILHIMSFCFVFYSFIILAQTLLYIYRLYPVVTLLLFWEIYFFFFFFFFFFIIYSFVCQYSFHYYWYCYNQKQSSGAVLQKRCSFKFRKIHKRTPKKRFRHIYFLVNSAKFPVTYILKNALDGCFSINTHYGYCPTSIQKRCHTYYGDKSEINISSS